MIIIAHYALLNSGALTQEEFERYKKTVFMHVCGVQNTLNVYMERSKGAYGFPQVDLFNQNQPQIHC